MLSTQSSPFTINAVNSSSEDNRNPKPYHSNSNFASFGSFDGSNDDDGVDDEEWHRDQRLSNKLLSVVPTHYSSCKESGAAPLLSLTEAPFDEDPYPPPTSTACSSLTAPEQTLLSATNMRTPNVTTAVVNGSSNNSNDNSHYNLCRSDDIYQRNNSNDYNRRNKWKPLHFVIGIDGSLKPGYINTLGPSTPVAPVLSILDESVYGHSTGGSANAGRPFNYTSEEEKQLVRKIDWKLLPILGMSYAVSTLSKEENVLLLLTQP
ncbi:hypothetical protein BX616_004095 [Lobosporangium transversale]|nr:hypothetical protein BX616_004095 [Lobosporangium transversale]